MKQAEFKDIAEFYNILKKIVKGYPPQYGEGDQPEMSALRLNTFAVVRSVKDFNADNANKRPQFADSPYFFNREWDDSGYNSGNFQISYPILALAEDKVILHRKMCDVYELDLMIVDQIPQFGAFYTDQYSKNREVEEVARDIRQHFKKLIAVLRNWVYAVFSDTSKNGWYDKVYLEAQNESYNIEQYLTDLLDLESLVIEVFPNIIDGCLIGHTKIKVQADNCVIGVPVIEYDTL